MQTLVICLVVLLAAPIYAQNVELNSTKVGGRQFTCDGDHVTFTCRVFGSRFLEWRNPLITQSTSYGASDTPPDILPRNPFTASLVSVSGTPLNANFISTLQVTASRMFMRNETTVMCLSSTTSKTDNFTVAEVPTAPLFVAMSQVERICDVENVNISISWMQPENFDWFDIDRYDITVNSTSGVQHMTTVCGQCTSTVITVRENPNNVPLVTTFTVTIAAVNLCGETGPVNVTSYSFGFLSPPQTPSYTVQQYNRETVTLTVQWESPLCDGQASVNYTITVVDPNPNPDRCSVPSNGITSATNITLVNVCYNVIYTVSIMATSGGVNSSAAVETIRIVNCSDPTPPMDGSIDPYQNTTEGAEIFFRCSPETGTVSAVCRADGRWDPNPATNCTSPPILTTNQIIGIAVGGGGGVILILIIITIICICICSCINKKKVGNAATRVEMK